MASLDSFGAKTPLSVGDASHEIFRIDRVPGHERLPYSLKVLLENLLRTEDGANVTAALSEARHPETGSPLFPRVISTAEAYGIDPAREGFPDLIAPPDDPYWVRCKLSKGAAWVEPDWTGCTSSSPSPRRTPFASWRQPLDCRA